MFTGYLDGVAVFIGCVKGRYDVTAGWWLRIPNMFKNLLSYEANDGREIKIVLWVEDGTPRFSYKDYEEPPYIPSGVQPQCDRGEWLCSVCRQTFSNKAKKKE